MALDEATVRNIARLARLKIADDDVPGLAAELSNILGWIEQLDEVPTDDVPPMASPTEKDLPRREDAVTDGGLAGDLMANAPDPAGSFFTVPKVVE